MPATALRWTPHPSPLCVYVCVCVCVCVCAKHLALSLLSSTDHGACDLPQPIAVCHGGLSGNTPTGCSISLNGSLGEAGGVKVP